MDQQGLEVGRRDADRFPVIVVHDAVTRTGHGARTDIQGVRRGLVGPFAHQGFQVGPCPAVEIIVLRGHVRSVVRLGVGAVIRLPVGRRDLVAAGIPCSGPVGQPVCPALNDLLLLARNQRVDTPGLRTASAAAFDIAVQRVSYPAGNQVRIVPVEGIVPQFLAPHSHVVVEEILVVRLRSLRQFHPLDLGGLLSLDLDQAFLGQDDFRRL